MIVEPERTEVKRGEIYEAVWSKPLPDLAEELRISVDSVKRICGLLNVPMPKSGHWRRVKTPRTKTLPPLKKGELERVVLVEKGEKRVIDSVASGPGIAKATRKLNVKDVETLIQRAERFYEFPTLGSNGLMKPKSKSWPTLRVSEAQKTRALKLADDLIKALQRQGSTVDWHGNLRVETPEGPLTFSIHEHVERVEVPPEPVAPQKGNRWAMAYVPKVYKDQPTGVLCVTITTTNWEVKLPSEWKDEGKLKLEKRVTEISDAMPAYAKAMRLKMLEWQENHRKWEEQWRVQEEERRVKKLEDDRRSRLETELSSWNRAKQIREYASELEQSYSQLVLPEQEGDSLATWLCWMRSHADKLDPLVRTPK